MRKGIIYSLLGLLILSTFGGCGNKKVMDTERASNRVMYRAMMYARRTARQFSREIRKEKNIPIEEKTIRSNVLIMGTEPSWNIYGEEQHYHHHLFNLLSSVVVGEYDVNLEDGSARLHKAPKAGVNSDLVLQAKGQNPDIQVLLEVGSHGDFGVMGAESKAYKKFFQNGRTWAKLADSVQILLDTMQAEGIVLDFANLPSRTGKAYARFVEDFAARLKKYTVFLKLPAVDKEKNFSKEVLTSLDTYIDTFIVKAYEYPATGKGKPIAPISKVKVSIDQYIALGLRPDQLLLEVPYYGWGWKGGQLSQDRPFRPYDELMEMSAGVYDRAEDESGVSFDEDGHTYWFEDEASLMKKYEDVVIAKKLKGINVLGLGYHEFRAHKKQSPWHAIDKKFAISPPKVVYPAIAFMLLFVWVGIAISVVWFWEVRNELARNRRQFWFYTGALSLVSIVMILSLIVVVPPLSTAVMSFFLVLFPFLRRFQVTINRWV